MTQEEKARAYDKAFEEAKNIHRFSSNIAEIKRMEQIFPELAESEDEKIRKELITHCRNIRCVTEEGAEGIAKWVAWLEKQGEQNPQRMVAAKAKEALYDKIVVSKDTIRLIIELFISWNGETEAIDIANLPTAVDYINEYINEN